MKKIFLAFFLLIFLTQCQKPKTTDRVDLDQAVELVCPEIPPILVIRTSVEEMREALRKQYSHDDIKDTVLKLPGGSNVMLPSIKPKDLKLCLVRQLPAVTIPSSMGY